LKLFRIVKVSALDEVLAVALTQKPVPYQPSPEAAKPDVPAELSMTGASGPAARPDVRAGV
jgi:hypothetical protein